MKVNKHQLDDVKFRELNKLYATLITRLLESVAPQHARHLQQRLQEIMQQETVEGLRVKLCDFVDYIDEVLVMADLLSAQERTRFVIWASCIARLGEEPAQRSFSPFGDERRIEIALPDIEVVIDE
ncbi:hypothetical protein GC175_28235 [bacterium]|nr:hypothetical protein [bacterium]